jgi:hypothetical protein
MCLIELGNMGKRALDSHSRSKKHQGKILASNSASAKTLSAWAHQPSTSSSTGSGTAESNILESKCTPQSLDSFAIKEDVAKAEIYWTLNVMSKHQSYNSTKHASALFPIMFPDSNVAKQFSCGPSKCSYLTAFGLAPYFEKKLNDKLQKVPFYSVCFDETFNRITKNEQMDFTVRFWDEEKQLVVNRYLGSQFLGHATASHILKSFNAGTSKLQKEKIIQVGMDGPNTNVKFHRDLIADRLLADEEIPTLIDIGTCGLHVIHGAFRTGFTSTGWKIDNLLKSLFYLFNESPARRADYSTITGSQVFPLQFCGTRWVEDLSVAQRAVEIWENITKYIEHVSNGPKSKIPKCASFISVNKAVNDPTTVAKLHVFINVAKNFQPFLKHFQSDKPMVPFMEYEIGKLLRSLMENFMKVNVLSNKKYMSDILKVDIEDSKNHIAMDKIIIGFAATASLTKALVSDVKLAEFKSQCLLCYKAIVLKIKNRATSPCNFNLVSQCCCLNPQYMLDHPNSTIDKIEDVLSTMIEHHFIKPIECDDLLKQYKALIRLLKLEHKEDCIHYDHARDMRIDAFFNGIIGNKTEYSKL